MAFPFSKIEADTIGSIPQWNIPVNEWLGLKFGTGIQDSVYSAVSRFTEDVIYNEGALMKPEVANKVFGIPGYLDFKEPIDIQQARLKNERKKKELKYLSLVESADHGVSVKGAIGIGASIAGSLANPLDLGLTFIPVVGQARLASGVAKIGGGVFRQALARGIITEEAIAATGIAFPRITGAVIDGTLNQAIAEIPVAIQKHRDQAEYTPLDSMINILAGGAFAGAVKTGLLALELKVAGRRWAELDPRIKQAEITELARQFVEGERLDGGGYVHIDESIIRERANARIGSEPTRKTVRAEAVKEFDAKVKEGGQVIEIDIPNAKVGDVIEGGEWNYKVVELAEGKTLAQPVPKTETPTVLREAQIDPALEAIAVKEASGVKLTNEEIALRDTATTPQELQAYKERVTEIKRAQSFDQVLADERTKAIKEFTTRKKAEYQAKLKDEIDAQTHTEIQSQINAGKTITPEQVKKHSFTPKDLDSAIATIEEDATSLQKTIMDNAITDEEKAALQAELDELNAEMDERPLDVEDAVEPAMPCVVSKASK